jgi:uncharacterized membrane protein
MLDEANLLWAVPVALAGGVAGSLGDSLLGASVQRIQICPQCKVETEQYIHRCGTPTVYRRGWRWLNNDWVNFLASILGAAGGTLVWLLLGT